MPGLDFWECRGHLLVSGSWPVVGEGLQDTVEGPDTTAVHGGAPGLAETKAGSLTGWAPGCLEPLRDLAAPTQWRAVVPHLLNLRGEGLLDGEHLDLRKFQATGADRVVEACPGGPKGRVQGLARPRAGPPHSTHRGQHGPLAVKGMVLRDPLDVAEDHLAVTQLRDAKVLPQVVLRELQQGCAVDRLVPQLVDKLLLHPW
mmetsp:Transcript_62540/g.111443  ORF Transcript_62540/g.111443 Transcript_62540/m.111443 type:complete len:201 (+) Transcript_62540:2006-2608(+)